jgi:hypothetical protein
VNVISAVGALVAKMKTQAFAEGYELTQSTDDKRAAYARIDQALERFMQRVRELEPLIEAVESYRELCRGSHSEGAEDPAAASRVIAELEKFTRGYARSTSPPPIQGFARAGDVQLDVALEPGKLETLPAPFDQKISDLVWPK